MCMQDHGYIENNNWLTYSRPIAKGIAKETEVCNWREKMILGKKINKTEDRAVLHTALRRQSDEPLIMDGENLTAHVQSQLEKMEIFVNKVRQGHWLGYSGKRITDIVNIGVGGSNLGPQMVTEALKHYSDGSVNVHYVSNVDGAQIAEAVSYTHLTLPTIYSV